MFIPIPIKIKRMAGPLPCPEHDYACIYCDLNVDIIHMKLTFKRVTFLPIRIKYITFDEVSDVWLALYFTQFFNLCVYTATFNFDLRNCLSIGLIPSPRGFRIPRLMKYRIYGWTSIFPRAWLCMYLLLPCLCSWPPIGFFPSPWSKVA